MLNGDPAPPPLPIFGPCLLWPNGRMNQDATSYVGRAQPRRHCVRWEPSSPLLKPLQFSANIRCGQTAGWTNMPLGMKVGLGSGDFVFDGHPAPLQEKGTTPYPIFGPRLLWPNDWMDQDAIWYRGKPRHR